MHRTSEGTAIVEDSAPGRKVGSTFIVAYALAYTGVWMALLTPLTITLALKIRQVSPDGAAGSLSLVLGIGALIALVANPFFGRLSDRTASRFGMRRPWILGGIVFGTGGLLLVAIAPNIPLILFGWCLTQLSFNAPLAAMAALLPDQVPAWQRGRVSGVVGTGLPVGLVGGAFIAQVLSGSIFLMFMAPAAAGLISVLILVAVLEDRRQSPGHRPPPYSPREFLSSFWVNPARHPDFGWAWLSRFLLYMGVAILITYQVFYLIDHLGMSEERVPGLVFVAALILNLGMAVFSVMGGSLSDLAGGRRKVFVWSSAAFFAFGATVIAFAGSFGTFLVGVAICGVGIGVYLAVDLALVSQVLPNRRDASKDLAVFAIASTLPQSLAPAIAPVFLNLPLFAGGAGEDANYTVLFFAAAVFSFAGAFAILPVRGVR
jgi:MFS family permease